MKNTRMRMLSAVLSAALLLPSFGLSLSAAEPVSRKMGDYTGAGTVIAVIDVGFNVNHKVFSGMPEVTEIEKSDVSRLLGERFAAGYVSEKIPYAMDYAALFDDVGASGETDTDVAHISDAGTSAAALAAGSYKGAGETVNEDGTVTFDADYTGTAPDAQLLLMKAAPDMTSGLLPEAVTAAVRDALSLRADVILINSEGLTVTEEVLCAFGEAKEASVPVITGAGDLSAEVKGRMKEMPAAVIDRGTLSDLTGEEGVYRIGAAADPYGHIISFTHGETEIAYIDSSLLYLGKSFAEVFAGQTVSFVGVPGVGAAADYAGLTLTGKIAVVRRGEIPFAEKAEAAADAGAVGMIVVDNGGGLVQMALDGTRIPAVIVSDVAGEALLAEGAPDAISLSAPMPGAASFSARGVTGDFKAALTLVTAGENLRCPTAEGFTYRPGTHLAAARAAGYCARTAEYMRAAGIGSVSPMLLLAAAASPLKNEDGAALPTREVGAGTLTGEETFPAGVPSAVTGRAVTAAVSGAEKNRCGMDFTLTNTGKTPLTYKASAAFTTDTVGEDGILTGGFQPVEGVTVTFGENGGTVTVPPRGTVTVTAQIRIPDGAVDAQHAPCGFFLDGVITLTAGEETVRHPVTLLLGDPDAAPLVDVSVYDGTDARIAPLYLAVRTSKTGTPMKIGTADPAAETTEWDEKYNFVNPAALREGALEIGVTALRDLAEARVRVRGEDGRILFEYKTDAIPRYLISGGSTLIPAGNFAGADDPAAFFPDGVYTVDVCFIAEDTDSRQDMTFTVRADSARPEIGDVSLTAAEGNTLTFTLSAKDNGALRGAWVYDLATQYENVALTGTEDTCTLTVTGYDGQSPLYFEVIDLAGLYRVVRMTAAEIAALVAAMP